MLLFPLEVVNLLPFLVMKGERASSPIESPLTVLGITA